MPPATVLPWALVRGASVAGLEFVQFHPTALRSGLDPLPLLTEALRGAGATLIAGGGRFMPGIDERAELAPRDIVARAVWAQQQRGDEVFLDDAGYSSRHEAGNFRRRSRRAPPTASTRRTGRSR